MRTPRIARVVGLAMALAVMAAGPAHARPDPGGSRPRPGGSTEARRFAEAIPYFDRVLERHHRDIEIRVKRGACYVATNQPAKALADFDSGQQIQRLQHLRRTAVRGAQILTTPTASATEASRC